MTDTYADWLYAVACIRARMEGAPDTDARALELCRLWADRPTNLPKEPARA